MCNAWRMLFLCSHNSQACLLYLLGFIFQLTDWPWYHWPHCVKWTFACTNNVQWCFRFCNCFSLWCLAPSILYLYTLIYFGKKFKTTRSVSWHSGECKHFGDNSLLKVCSPMITTVFRFKFCLLNSLWGEIVHCASLLHGPISSPLFLVGAWH